MVRRWCHIPNLTLGNLLDRFNLNVTLPTIGIRKLFSTAHRTGGRQFPSPRLSASYTAESNLEVKHDVLENALTASLAYVRLACTIHW